jgi:hypothetical protein
MKRQREPEKRVFVGARTARVSDGSKWRGVNKELDE